MIYHVAILEDDPNRLVEMRACLDNLLPQYQHCFFDNASEMIAWLQENLATVMLISLDHDLPFVQYRMGKRVEAGDGRMVANYLATQLPVCPIIVHFSNTECAPGMCRVLRDSGWEHKQVQPFGDYEWVRKAWAQEVDAYLKSGWLAMPTPPSQS